MVICPSKNFNIKRLTSFKIGGEIDEVFFPETIDEFVAILEENPDIKVFGNLTNTLISDDGFNGKILLTTKMNDIKIDGEIVTALSGVKVPKLSQEVCNCSLSGLEFMIGFPASIGGAVYMNASAHKQAVCDTLQSATCYSKELGLVKYSKDEMKFDYRHSRCQEENLIVLGAEFKLTKKPIEEIQTRMKENLDFRRTHQPSLALPNCGSIFKNPKNDSAGRLLDSVGGKNLSCGGVRVWENHANFIVNDNNGTSQDVLNLMYEMYKKVKEQYNIELAPEIRFLGGNNEKENNICKILYQK